MSYKIKVFSNGYTGFKRPTETKYYYVPTGSALDKGLRKKFKHEQNRKKIN